MSERGEGATASDNPLPYEVHPLRDAIVAEVHARPFRPVETPRVVHHMGFMAEVPPEAELEAFARFCRAHGSAPPAPDARHHVLALGNSELRWERHTEFTTVSLIVAPPAGDPFRAPNTSSLAAFLPKPPGPLLVATRLALVPASGEGPAVDGFDAASVCVASVDGGNGTVITDFRPDASGFTRIRVENVSLTPERAGALVQRLLEIDTYRTLALLGLPEAQRLSPVVARIERDLTQTAMSMRRMAEFESSRELLDGLVGLAAEIESEAAAVAYRFAATQAYEEIVAARLGSIRETRVPGYSTIDSFLGRRMRPAMRTCRAVQERVGALSEKVARTSNLLRTRVDIDLESQNRDLLDSMNRRARLQLRLQRTVEGLSVAAVSYYVVGLVAYLAEGGREVLGWAYDPNVVAAAAVPVVVLAVWYLVRRIRRRHSDDG